MAATSAAESDQSGLWWSSWLSSAKETSISALSATKRDLAEFVSVLSTDTKAAVEGASVNINKILKQNSGDEAEDKPSTANTTQTAEVTAELQAPYDRCRAQLFALQTNRDTYLQDPTDQEEFDSWKSSFDIQHYQGEISNLLVSCLRVRNKHSHLVPAKVSYEMFWMRYFYRAQRLQKEEKRREDLMARASNRHQEEQLQWDEEVEVISNPLLAKTIASGHQRSESSTDSFVCVSEETGLEGDHSPPQTTADTESWEYLESGASVSHGSSGGRLSEVGEEEDVKKGLDRLFKKHGSPMQDSDEENLVTTDNQLAKNGEEGEEEANLSDWEKWDD